MCRAPMRCSAMRPIDRHPEADRIEEIARSLVGVRFRPQGRDPRGCDCLGLSVLVAARAGISVDVPPQPMRGSGLEVAIDRLRRNGCTQVEFAQPGDLMLQAPATLQVHLAVRVEGGLIEAHAGLRRVVFRPLGAWERWHSGWRFPQSGD